MLHYESDASELEPGTPMDDLFGNTPPLEFVGQELQVDSESNVQGSTEPPAFTCRCAHLKGRLQ